MQPRKLLSLLLALALCAGLFAGTPLTAFAADEIELNQSNAATVLTNLTNGDTVKLMEDVTYNNGLSINTVDDSSSYDGYTAAVWVKADTTTTTLTDDGSGGTGVSISGNIDSGASLTVAEIGSGDTSGNAIRAQAASGTLLALYEINITDGSFTGNLTITIPLFASYNDQTVTIIHDNHGILETQTATVTGGAVTFTLTSLSPVGAVNPGDDYEINQGGVETGYTWADTANITLNDGDVMTILRAGSPAAATAIIIAQDANVTINGIDNGLAGSMITNLFIRETSSDTQAHDVNISNLQITAPAGGYDPAYTQYKGVLNLSGNVCLDGGEFKQGLYANGELNINCNNTVMSFMIFIFNSTFFCPKNHQSL